MAIPLKYNLRNLRARFVTTLVTALSISLTVAIFITLMALANGLRMAFVSTGHPRNLIVLRQNAGTETNSTITPEAFQVLKYLPGVARNEKGEPLASAETIVLINLPRVNTTERSNVLIRGLSFSGLALHPQVKLVEGRWFEPGSREIVVSRQISRRFQKTRMGDTLRFGKGDWKVVGIFEAAGTAYDSEIWCDGNQVRDDYNRHLYSSVYLQVEDSTLLEPLSKRIHDDQRLQLDAKGELQYYAEQTGAGKVIQVYGMFISIVMAIGSGFAAMNAMYGAVVNRFREIGILRVLGFSKMSILLSFAIESLILALIGGGIGCLLALPINGISTGTTNFQTFSEITFTFRVTPELLLWGMIFSGLIGLWSGLFPAIRAARKPILEALRAVV
jgi:putative ABC transport system permease protein